MENYQLFLAIATATVGLIAAVVKLLQPMVKSYKDAKIKKEEEREKIIAEDKLLKKKILELKIKIDTTLSKLDERLDVLEANNERSFKNGELLKEIIANNKLRDSNIDKMLQGSLATLKDRIRYLAKLHIVDNFINVDDLLILEAMHESYHSLGGNGPVDVLMSEVRKLPKKAE